MFWTDASGSGSHPAPFTLITSEDIEQGTWVPVQDEHKVTKHNRVACRLYGRIPYPYPIGRSLL